MSRESQTVQLERMIRTRGFGSGYGNTRTAVSIARSLVRAAKALGRIGERLCSEEMSVRELLRVERETKRLEALVKRHAESIGAKVCFQGDPRGYSVMLHFGPDAKRQPSNTFGGSEHGWGIG